MTTPIQLAEGVRRMLEAQLINPVPVYDPAPIFERDASHDTTRIYVTPADTTSQILDRAGNRVFARAVDIAVVRNCYPSDSSQFAQLLGLCDEVGEALARHKPLDESDEPYPVSAIEINHEPLYSVERLREGLFVGVIRARYMP